MKKPLHVLQHVLKKIYLLPFLLPASLCFSFFTNAQTISTAAGDVTWSVNVNSDISEVELDRNGNYHSDGFDDAMFVNVTGTNIIYTNSYHFSGTYGAVIQNVAIINSGAAPSAFTLTSSGNMGSDGSTSWHYVSTAGFRYTISSDGFSPIAEGSDPVISLCYGDASLNSYSPVMYYSDGDDNTSFTVSNVPIAAGATVRFLILCGIGNIDDDLSNRPDQALPAVQNLADMNNWPADFTSFLSSAEKAQVINWAALSTLPVTWQSFTAQLQNESVSLNWSTANEQNTKDFTVQHSTDGANWSNIALLNAAGNSNAEAYYQFIHGTPANGDNYYRLLQTDIDGRSSCSEIKVLWLGKQQKPITVLGNPVKNGKLMLLLLEKQTIRLLGTNGKLYLQSQLAAGVRQVDVSRLSVGVYFLQSSKAIMQVVISKQ